MTNWFLENVWKIFSCRNLNTATIMICYIHININIACIMHIARIPFMYQSAHIAHTTYTAHVIT